MTKAALVEEVARITDLTKKDAEVIVDTVFRCIVGALRSGEKVELRGFGSFRLRRREPRKGRNPKTGDRVDVPPKKVPYFKPGKELKELINRAGRPPSAPVAGPGTARAAPGRVERDFGSARPLRGVRQPPGDEGREYARGVVEGLPVRRQVSPRRSAARR